MHRIPALGCQDGQIHVRWHNGTDQEWVVFESLPEAVAFAEAEVIAHPISQCGIFDSARKTVEYLWNDLCKEARTIRMGWAKVLRENAPATDCPECLQDMRAQLAYLDNQKSEYEKWYAALAARLGLAQGMPTDPAERASFDLALQRLKNAWCKAGREGEVAFEDTKILSSPRWWFIPFGWVGCSGFIVDRESGHVNKLGSCHGLDLCFWAQDHGIVAGDTDFVIHEVRDMEHAQAVVQGFIHPSWTTTEIRHYSKQEAAQVLASLPAEFPSQELWFSFPHIREAAEVGAFTFTARPALHPRNRLGTNV